MLCGIMMATNFDGYAEIDEKMEAVDPKRERESKSHSLPLHAHPQHTARQHSENVGEFAARLFAQTTDLEMDYVKESVFGKRSSSDAKTVQDTHR